MIHNLAKRMASVFVLYGESSEEDADIYTYACEAVLAVLANIIICLIIAFIFGRVTEGIIFIFAFILLRRYAGGHHAKTHFNCILTFGVIFTCAMMLVPMIRQLPFGNFITLTTALAAGIGISALAPAEHKNKLSGHEFHRAQKKKSMYLVFALWLFCLIDFYILNSRISFIIALSMLSVFGSMAYATIYSCVELRKGVKTW